MHLFKHIQQPSLVVAALIVGFLSAVAVVAVADGDPTTDDVPRTLPYQGVLEIDGEPLDANGANGLNIMFMLYDGQASDEPVYRQNVRVDVYAGRFTTTIGPLGLNEDDEEVIISDIITNADDLYLGMTLLGDLQDPDDDVLLANRQRIHATPYSMWTTSATNIAVANNAIVGGDLNVSGTAAVGEGRPPESAAQLRTANNVAEGAPDAFNDYQVLLHQKAAAAESAGVGVQDEGDTIFMNASRGLKVYENGLETLGLTGGDLTTGSLTTSGGISSTGDIVSSGDIVSTSGVISGNFQISNAGFNVQRNNSSGTSRVEMGSTSRRLCFLTRVGMIDVDSGSERAECGIVSRNGQWTLEARLTNANDTDVYCSARCLTW